MSHTADGIARLDQDQVTFFEGASCRDVPHITASQYAAAFGVGLWPIEHDVGISLLASRKRETIPVVFHIPHGVRDILATDKFLFSTNREFSLVMDECSLPRMGGLLEDQWIREEAKEMLLDLHQSKIAHSVEVYDRRDQQVVGGILGLTIHGLFVSLSVYSHASGAGNAAFVALQGILCRHKYLMHDAIMPSAISRLFGGDLNSMERNSPLRKLATSSQNKDVVFPSFLSKLSVAEYVKILMGNQNGRTFSRQKCDASEGENRGQALENIREISAGNISRRKTGPAGPGS
jgi:leucyl/phenylalanyl-tRNA--protein transferase